MRTDPKSRQCLTLCQLDLPDYRQHVPRVLHRGVLLAAFLYLTLALRKKLWELSKVDYTRPARSFLFYLLVCAMGFYFTYQNWKRDKAPLLEEIRRWEDALREEGGAA